MPVGMAASDPPVMGACLSAPCIAPASAITVWGKGAYMRHPISNLLQALLTATHHVIEKLQDHICFDWAWRSQLDTRVRFHNLTRQSFAPTRPSRFGPGLHAPERVATTLGGQ